MAEEVVVAVVGVASRVGFTIANGGGGGDRQHENGQTRPRITERERRKTVRWKKE